MSMYPWDNQFTVNFFFASISEGVTQVRYAFESQIHKIEPNTMSTYWIYFIYVKEPFNRILYICN